MQFYHMNVDDIDTETGAPLDSVCDLMLNTLNHRPDSNAILDDDVDVHGHMRHGRPLGKLHVQTSSRVSVGDIEPGVARGDPDDAICRQGCRQGKGKDDLRPDRNGAGGGGISRS